MAAAPSLGTIRSLELCGVIKYPREGMNADGGNESKSDASITRDAAFEAAIRCAAVIACQQLSERILDKLKEHNVIVRDQLIAAYLLSRLALKTINPQGIYDVISTYSYLGLSSFNNKEYNAVFDLIKS